MASSTENSNLGTLIKESRKASGLSQEKFAAALGVSFTTVNRWENGQVTPSPLAIEKLCQHLESIGQRTDSRKIQKAAG